MAKQVDNDNLKTGYIKIFRSLKKHWIWQDDRKLKWWLDILLDVNHADQKVLIGNDVIECKKGQSLKSIESWAKQWRTDRDTVRRFFKLLEKDKMIETEGLTKTTQLTICNYDSYNDSHPTKTQQKPTNNNVKNNTLNNKSKDIEDKQKVFYNMLVPFVREYGKDMLRDFYDYWSEPSRNGVNIKWEKEETWDTKRRLDRWKRNQKDKPEQKKEITVPIKNSKDILKERGQ